MLIQSDTNILLDYSNVRLKTIRFRRNYSKDEIDPEKLENIDQEIKFQPIWDDHKRNYRFGYSKISLHIPSGPIGPAKPPPPLPTVKYWRHRKLIENDVYIVKGFRVFEKNIRRLADTLKKSKDEKINQLLNKKSTKNKEVIQKLSDSIDRKLLKFYDAAYACRHIWKYELASIRQSEDKTWRRFTEDDWNNMAENELIYWRNYIISHHLKDCNKLEREKILSDSFSSSMLVMKECDEWFDLMMKVELINKSKYLSEEDEAKWKENVNNLEWVKAINACVKRMLDFDKKSIQNKRKFVLNALNHVIRHWNKEHLAYLLELKAIYDWGKIQIENKFFDPVTKAEALERWDKCIFILSRNIQQLRMESPFFFDFTTLTNQDYDFLYNELFNFDTEDIGKMLDSELFFNTDSEKNKVLDDTTIVNSIIDDFNFEEENNQQFNITPNNYEYINLIYNSIVSGEINPYLLLRDIIIKANQDKYYNTVEYLSTQFDLDAFQIENAIKLSSPIKKSEKDIKKYSHEFKIDKELIRIDISEEEYKLIKNLEHGINECKEMPNWIIDKFKYFNFGRNDPVEDYADTTILYEDPNDIVDILETVQYLFVDTEIPKDDLYDPLAKYEFGNNIDDSSNNVEASQDNNIKFLEECQEDINTIKDYIRGLRFSHSNAVLWLKSLNQETIKKLPININPKIWNEKEFKQFIEQLDDTFTTFVQVPVFIERVDKATEKEFSKHENYGQLLFHIKYTAKELSRAYRYEKEETKAENKYLVDKYEYIFELYLKVNILDMMKEKSPEEMYIKNYVDDEVEKTLPNSTLSWMLHLAMTPFRVFKNFLLLPSIKLPEDRSEKLKFLIEEDSVKPWKFWISSEEQDVLKSEYFSSMSNERASYWSQEIEYWNHQYKKELLSLGVNSNFENRV